MKTFFKLFFLFCCFSAQSQNFTVLADSLRVPLGVQVGPNGKTWVTEVGYGFNDGAVSIVNPDGSLSPVIVGLPSIFDTVEQEPVGPWRSMLLPGNKLAVMEPLIGGAFVFDLSGFTPGVTPPLTAANAISQVIIADFVYQNEPANAPDSDPYSVALDDAGNWYIADAAFNGIVKVDAATGQRSVFATFARFPNPLPFGPPEVDPVPTRILRKPGGGFYVCTLTGFPFLEGAASVFALDMSGNITPYATNLNLLTDLALDANTGNLYALQFGQFVLDPVAPGFAPNSAKIIRIKTDGTQQLVAENFGPAAGLALNSNGDLIVTDIYQGLLLKVSNITTGTVERPSDVNALTLTPNPTNGPTQVSFSLEQASDVRFSIFDVLGNRIFTENLGHLSAGPNQVQWNGGMEPAGTYFVEIQTANGRVQQKVVVILD